MSGYGVSSYGEPFAVQKTWATEAAGAAWALRHWAGCGGLTLRWRLLWPGVSLKVSKRSLLVMGSLARLRPDAVE